MSSVGDDIIAPPGAWSFAGETATAFDAHVVRSIPFYADGHDLVAGIADVLLGPGSRCYDLGCSTGALTAKIADRVATRSVHIVGVDREPDMLAMARHRLPGDVESAAGVSFVEADLATFELEPCDLVVAYYTLQFLPLDARADVVRRIRDALRPGGALVCFDKVLADGARTQNLATAVYHDWKRAAGFDDAEIANKDRSLRGILRPLTSDEQREMLHRAGFTDVSTIFTWVCWEGLLALA